MAEPKETTTTLSPEELEQLWADHLKGEFETKDVEETLATMVDDAYVNHMPVNTGGRGKEALRVFYRDDFIPSWPDDLEMTPVNRVVGEGQLVDELHVTFTHKCLYRNKFMSFPPENEWLRGAPHALTSGYIKIILHRHLPI